MKEIFFLGFLFVVLTVGLTSLGIFLDSKECHSKYSAYQPEYSFFSGCRINFQGKLTPVDMIKNINLN